MNWLRTTNCTTGKPLTQMCKIAHVFTQFYLRVVLKTLCLFMNDSYGSSFSRTFHDVCTTPITPAMTGFLHESFNWHELNYSYVMGTTDVWSTLPWASSALLKAMVCIYTTVKLEWERIKQSHFYSLASNGSIHVVFIYVHLTVTCEDQILSF